MAELIEKHEAEIAVLVEDIRGYKAQIEQINELLDSAREQVELFLTERGTPWKDAEGYAMIVGEGERTSYDTKALDELLISDPVKYGWLTDYRKKTVIKASLKIK